MNHHQITTIYSMNMLLPMECLSIIREGRIAQKLHTLYAQLNVVHLPITESKSLQSQSPSA